MPQERSHLHQRLDRIDQVLDDNRSTYDNTGSAAATPHRLCWRCLSRPSGEGSSGVCDECREILLADVYDPPSIVQVPEPTIIRVTVRWSIHAEDMARWILAIGEAAGVADAQDHEIVERALRTHQADPWVPVGLEWLIDGFELADEADVAVQAIRVQASTNGIPPVVAPVDSLETLEEFVARVGHLVLQWIHPAPDPGAPDETTEPATGEQYRWGGQPLLGMRYGDGRMMSAPFLSPETSGSSDDPC